jgi:hypothetical protein
MSITRRSLSVVAAAAATLVLAGPSGATAATAPAPVVCEGVLSGVTVGDVTVPYDASCTLRNVDVRGNVTSELDSNVLTVERSAVSGNVSVEGRRLVLTTSAIRGNVTATESRGGVVVTQSAVQGDVTATAIQGELRLGSLESLRYGNVVGGDLTVDSSFVEGTVARNVVAGALVLTNNQAAVEVRRNVVRGALTCTGNAPEPFGGSNVAGSKLDQCSGL